MSYVKMNPNLRYQATIVSRRLRCWPEKAAVPGYIWLSVGSPSLYPIAHNILHLHSVLSLPGTLSNERSLACRALVQSTLQVFTIYTIPTMQYVEYEYRLISASNFANPVMPRRLLTTVVGSLTWPGHTCVADLLAG